MTTGTPVERAPITQRPAWLQYGLALLVVVLTTLVRFWLEPVLLGGTLFAVYCVPVLIAAWIGGVGPGFLAIGASAISAAHFFLEPAGSLFLSNPEDRAGMTVFLLVALAIVAITNRQRESQLSAEMHALESARTAEALKNSEESHRLIISNALDAVVSMDLEGRITAWNPAAEEVLGWSAEEAIGRRMSETIIPERYRSAHENGLAQFAKTGVAPVVDQRLRLAAIRKDGLEIPIELTVSLIRTDGKVSFSAFIRDMTADQALEEARERLATTLGSIGDAVIATDSEGLVTFMNPVAEQLTGWPVGEAQGKDADAVFRIVHEVTRDVIESPWKQVLAHGSTIGLANHTMLLRRDGKEVPIEDSAAPIRLASGEISGVVLVFHDVSERKHREDIQRFLASATETLAASLDYHETLAKVAQLATPRIADWCAVDMLADGGGVERLAITHVDPGKIKYALELQERYPPKEGGPAGVYNIIRTGESELMSEIPDSLLVQEARDEEHLRIARELGLHSYMGVPLKVENQVIGAISFVTAESKRSYTREDLLFAEELAGRASIAIHNARLYEDAKREIEERARAQRRVAELNEELSQRLIEVQKLADIVESSDDAIISVTLDGMITNWNAGAERVFGYTAQEIVGKHMAEITPADRRHELFNTRDRLLAGEHIGHFETIRLRKDGSEIDISVGAAPIKDASGTVIGLSLLDRDISERKVAEELQAQLMEAIEAERKRLTDILATVPGVVWEAWGKPDEAAQRVDFVSDYVTQMLGYGVDQWLSEPNFWLRIVHPDDKERAGAAAAAIYLSGKAGGNQFRWVAKDGRIIWVHSYAVAINDEKGDSVGMRGVTIDISKQMEAEQARLRAEETLREMNLELERRVKDRTAELSAANTELEAFSYSVSHDLRAPLRALDGFSRILIEDYSANLDAEAKDYLNRIRLASQRMGQLIEDLLNMAYVTRTEMHREKVDLTDMLCRIAEELNDKEVGRQVRFRAKQGLIVDADARLLRAALENLMQNAWKFTSQKAGAAVEAGTVESGGATAYYIKDNGAGFDQTYVSKLFQPFQRLHSMSEYGGTGIGLATVQRIIQRHGGSIWAEGEVDKGATFYFTL